MWTLETGGLLFTAPWDDYNIHMLSLYCLNPTRQKLQLLHKDHKEAVAFKKKLDEILVQGRVAHPKVCFNDVFDTHTGGNILDIYSFTYKNWTAYFRANHSTMILKGIMMRDTRISLNSSLTSILSAIK